MEKKNEISGRPCVETRAVVVSSMLYERCRVYVSISDDLRPLLTTLSSRAQR